MVKINELSDYQKEINKKLDEIIFLTDGFVDGLEMQVRELSHALLLKDKKEIKITINAETNSVIYYDKDYHEQSLILAQRYEKELKGDEWSLKDWSNY